jgi:SAM-dependent methyltransferase
MTKGAGAARAGLICAALSQHSCRGITLCFPGKDVTLLGGAVAVASRKTEVFPKFTETDGEMASVLRRARRLLKQWGQTLPNWDHGTFAVPPTVAAARKNPLQAFFEARTEGAGIWKWQHYFDIYDRHFTKFRGRPAHVLEIGVYSGGSLDMWRDYFGPAAQIYGVDIEPACRAYETIGTRIIIGDQADRMFWRSLRQEGLTLDVVIDDGGHKYNQQMASFEELMPCLRPGGVYLCEDVQGAGNLFASYIHKLGHELNQMRAAENNPASAGRRLACRATPIQAAIASIHLYPFVTVVERNDKPVTEFIAPKRGTVWQPFLH